MKYFKEVVNRAIRFNVHTEAFKSTQTIVGDKRDARRLPHVSKLPGDGGSDGAKGC